MKSIFILSIILLSNPLLIAQDFTKVKEIRITEKALGKVAFHFTDNDHNGQFEFIADANNQAGIFTGEIIDNEIVTKYYKNFTQFANDLRDLRLEDTNGDGKRELYALYESMGLIILDTVTLSPLDTISEFPVSVLFRRMILADIDHDLVDEWIMLDGFDGITVYELNTFTPKWNAPELDGQDMQLGNLDGDAALELVLRTSSGIRIINIETQEEEYFIPSQVYEEIELTDLNQDGIDELILIDGTLLQLYDHTSNSITESYSTGLIHYDDRFYLNIDSDTALEIILYQPDYNAFVELNTYPLSFRDYYKLPDDVSLGWYAGQIPGAPGKFVFLPEEGISIFDIFTKTVETTKITGSIAGILSTKLDHIDDEVLITHPAEASWDYLSFRTLNDFKTVFTLSQNDLFEGHIADFASTVDKLHARGIQSDRLLINNNREFCIYDPVQNTHINYLDLQGDDLTASDLNHDGSDELLNTLNNSIHVYQQSEARKFEPLFSTPPTELYINFITGQLDQTPEKEIIGFNYQKILVYSGRTGELLHEVTGIPSATYQDVTTFSDSTGDYFIGVMIWGTYYVYNYTQKILAKTFNFHGTTTGFTKILQMLDAGQLKTYILIYSDRFQVYSPDGTPIFIEDLATGSNTAKSKIIINDYNQDSRPDILLSAGSKFTIYTYTGAGVPVTPFYATSIFPKDSITLNTPTSYILQFSEPVLPGSVSSNLVVESRKQGSLAYEIEWIDEFQIRIIPEPLQFNPDTVTLMIHGGLQCESQKFLDNNLDGIGLQTLEPIELAVYLYDSSSADYKPTIIPLSDLPERFVSESKRHLDFRVNTDLEAPFPIHFMHSGILSGNIISSDSLYPIDGIFDEPVEDFLIPVPTFGLADGTYMLYLLAGDIAGNLSDTLFVPFQVISEKGNYDKNAGGGFTRSQYIDNNRITPYFDLLKVKLHASTERLSHIVGGDGYVYYLDNNSFDHVLTLRKASLPYIETVWEHTFPSNIFRSSIHLSDGFIYFIKQASQDSEFRVFAYDAITGTEIWNEQIYSKPNLNASPITDNENVLVTGGEYGGTYCFNRWTGEQKWYSKRDDNHYEEGIPALYKNAAYLAEHQTIKSINLSSGAVNWEIAVTEEEAYLLERNALVDSLHQQLIWPGKINIYAFDLETSQQKWKRPGSNSIKNPVQCENHIFLFKSNAVVKLNATTGSTIKTLTLPAEIKVQPVGANGKLFLPLEDRFLVLDMYTLATLWTLPIKVQEITIIDQYLLLTDNMEDVHIYESLDQCCNSSMVWTESNMNAFSPGIESFKYTFDSIPTILDNHSYNEILFVDSFTSEDWKPTGDYIRSEGKQVYQYRFGQESLLYDFSAATGDTIIIRGTAVAVTAVDSIMLENGETRRRLTMQCTQIEGLPPYYWIEGIGSSNGFTTGPCNFDWYSTLLCAYQNDELLYRNAEIDSCWQFVSASDDIQKHDIHIFPNPFDDQITLEAGETIIVSVELTDILGQKVFIGKDETINTKSVLPGSYVLLVRFKDGSAVIQKLIKI